MPAVLFHDWDRVLDTAVATPLVYVMAVAAVRIAGRRTLAQMSAFDVVVTVAIGSVVAASILPSSPSVAEGLTGLVLLLACQVAIGAVRQRFPRLRRVLDFQPELITHAGRVHLSKSATGPQVTDDDVQRAIRGAGHARIGELTVVLESDGTFSVLTQNPDGLLSTSSGLQRSREGGYVAGMPNYDVNKPAVRKARSLIDDGKIDTDTEWSDAAPSREQGNDVVDDDGYDGFGEWHLAVDPEASEDTKGRYAFPYGDFKRVNRAALIHAKQRAAQNDHDEIEKAADELLDYLDKKAG